MRQRKNKFGYNRFLVPFCFVNFVNMEKAGSNQQPPQAIIYTAPVRPCGGSGAFDVNENDPRYKCCCGCMYVRNGAMLLAIVELVFSVLGVLGALGDGGGRKRIGTSSVSFINCAVTIVVSALMIYGIKKTKRYFLVPHVIYQLIFIVACMVGAIFFAISSIGSGSTSNGHGSSSEEYSSLVCAIAAVLCLVMVVLNCWFFVVVWATFRYLRDKETAKMQGTAMIQYGGGAV
uniref:MARVEL domain-containing protein n=1 Tax=Romanomermis culicivorax TaxID=13658 RepID=A0A915HNZ6_ROMCU